METLKRMRSAAMEELLLGHHSQALDLYDKVANLAGTEFGANSSYLSDLYFAMGSLAFESSRFQQAEEYLSQSVKIKPTSLTARVRLAELLLLRGRPDEAKDQAEKALRQQANNWAARKVLAMSYLKTDDPAKATQAFAHLNAVINGRSAPIPASPTHNQEIRTTLQDAIKTTTPETKIDYPVKVKPKVLPTKESKLPPRAATKPKPRTQAQLPPAPPSTPKPRTPELKTEPRQIQVKVKSAPRGGLVPPPPPTMPIFGGFVAPPPVPPAGVSNPGFQLKTEAKVKREPKPKEPAPEEPSTHTDSGGDDSDFLLDWAGDKGSKKRHN